jgi:O-glycosyl hydrolase
MHTYPEIPNSAQFMLQMQNMDAESLSGVKAFHTGITGQSLGSTATSVRGALDAASKREMGILRRLSNAIVKIGRKIVSMNSEFLSDREVIRITNDEFVKVDKNDLAGNVDLKLSIYTAEEERDFLKKHLGPTLFKAGMSNKKIIVWDHNRDLLFHRASVILGDKDAAKYVWGIGYHWYETWAGGAQMHQNLDMVNEMFPDKNLIFTEGCKEAFNAERYNAWELGEYYANAMIKDFNNGVNAWTDWNIFLDEKGGPNHKDNFCFAPVHVNTKTNEIIYTNAYYYIGHFSKFIRPGARRLACASSRSNIQATAFKNIDGKISVIVMNETDKEVKYTIQMNAYSVSVVAPAHSIQTIVY